MALPTALVDRFMAMFDEDNNVKTSVGGSQSKQETDLYSSPSALTITLASLAHSVAGVGRQSAIVDNTLNLYQSALVSVKITVGTTPTINTPIYIYLIRDNNDLTPIRDDGAGVSDAAITIVNASLLGVIIVPATTSDTAYYSIFDTSQLGPLGPKWGIAVVNGSGVSLNATAGNHVVSFIGVKKNIG